MQKDGDVYTHFVDGDTLFSLTDTSGIGINNNKMYIGGSSTLNDWFDGVIDDIVIAGNYGNCNYNEPNDNDNNGVYDFLEFGGEVVIDSISDSKVITEETTALYIVSSTSLSEVSYRWQFSDDSGVTWKDIEDTTHFEGFYTDSLRIVDAPLAFSGYVFRVLLSTPSFVCGSVKTSEEVNLIVLPDNDLDGIPDSDDLDDDNDGIYDSIECFNTSSLIISGDVDSTYSSSYPIIANYVGNTGSGGSTDLYKNDINVSMTIGSGDIYENCYFVSDMNFDDGLDISIDGKTILYFDQYHWDISRVKADPDITREFSSGGIFGTWVPWSTNTKIQLVIRSGSIKLFSETSDGRMVDVIPYMDNTVDDWVLDKDFNLSCEDGFNLLIGNTNHNGPSSFYSNNKIYAYVCNDVDGDNNLNNRDLDSDNDDCFDVSEAGFDDQDSDGFLGNSPVNIDSVGRVIYDGSGYSYPVDNDNNGIMDFIEEGFTANIISTPDDYSLVKEGDTFSLYVDVDLRDRFVYQWQLRDEYSLFWENLNDTIMYGAQYLGTNTNRLQILGVEFEAGQIDNMHLYYRLVISSPSYYCEDDIYTAAFELEIYHKDLHIPNAFSPNSDGINDYWVIRGIEGYPKNKVRIYNRWNNRVFEKKGYDNDWDGTNQMQIYFGDGRLPEGTYFYILDLGDGKKPFTGFVYIKRE